MSQQQVVNDDNLKEFDPESEVEQVIGEVNRSDSTIVFWYIYYSDCFFSVLAFVLGKLVIMLLVFLGFEEVQAALSVVFFCVILFVVSFICVVLYFQLELYLSKECKRERAIVPPKTEEMSRNNKKKENITNVFKQILSV